ncbi:MAG: hypothetical protein AABW41_02120 [Nanoarchaeota archaeon]
MKKRNFLSYIIIISIIGVLFAGYLTYGTFSSGNCPLIESCPYYFNLPACGYGLIIYGIILLFSLIAFINKKLQQKLMTGIFYISIVGILFSAFSSIYEIFYLKCASPPCRYSLLLPTCVYGLVMYTAIFLLSKSLKKK